MHHWCRILRSQRSETPDFERLEEVSYPESAPIDIPKTEHNQADMAELMEKADPQVRGAVILRYAHSHSWDHVARQLRTDCETLKGSCQRELEKIRELLRAG